MSALTKLSAETSQVLKENKTQMDKLENNMGQIDSKVQDLGVALAKTSRFDTRIQNDSQAVLTKVSEKCVQIENLVLNTVAKGKETIISKKEAMGNKDNVETDKTDKREDAPKRANQRSVKKNPKVTWVGTSLSKALDEEKFENDANVDLTVEKAYCIAEEGRYKNKNFAAIVPKIVERGDIDTLVLQTGSIEITNVDVNKAMMDATKDIKVYKKDWYEKAEKDSTKLFSIAEDAIAKDPHLNVIIVKRPPRFDRASKDISGIKSQLSKFSNHVYDQLWLKNGSPSRIHIVELELDCENSQYLKDIIYGQPQSPKYDGIHLVGNAASRHFTYRAVQVMLPIVNPSFKPMKQFSSLRQNFRAKIRTSENVQLPAERVKQDNSHTNCEQAQYQRQSGRSSHGVKSSNRRTSYADTVKGKQGNVYNTSNIWEHLNC